MTLRFDTDNPDDVAKLFELHPPESRFPFKRSAPCGSRFARSIGLTPVYEAIPDRLIDWNDLEGVIAHSHEKQNFPMYYLQDTWCPRGTKYDQNGLGYCWTWSGTGCVMTTRATENKPTVLLAPVSMGYLVNWANAGNYLESFVEGARNDGICPAVDGEMNSHKNSRSYWSQYNDKRKLYRLDAVWDTDSDASDKERARQCISILSYGKSCYCALNWWGHAIEYVGWRYTPGTYLNLTAVIHNSHAETDFIELTGSRCVPDECYGFISTVPVE